MPCSPYPHSTPPPHPSLTWLSALSCSDATLCTALPPSSNASKHANGLGATITPGSDGDGPWSCMANDALAIRLSFRHSVRSDGSHAKGDADVMALAFRDNTARHAKSSVGNT